MQPRRNNMTAYALWANAALLAGLLIAMLSRGNTPNILPQAFGQYPQPIAGASGIYIMPGQLSTNVWGCYLVDVDSQTLVTYQFSPGDKQLRMVAARNFRFDRKLGNFNTTPFPQEVSELVKKEQQINRVVGSNTGTTAPETLPKDAP